MKLVVESTLASRLHRRAQSGSNHLVLGLRAAAAKAGVIAIAVSESDVHRRHPAVVRRERVRPSSEQRAHDLGVALARRAHQSSAALRVLVVKARAELDKQLHGRDVALCRGKLERRDPER